MGRSTRLSENFTLGEFYCKDGTPPPEASVPAIRELCVHMLEPLRAKYGPCKVTSGYRNRSYNARIGGARASQHIYNDGPGSVAADVTFARGSVSQWARSARWRFRFKKVWRSTRRGGAGDYVRSGFIHVDSGPRRDWRG